MRSQRPATVWATFTPSECPLNITGETSARGMNPRVAYIKAANIANRRATSMDATQPLTLAADATGNMAANGKCNVSGQVAARASPKNKTPAMTSALVEHRPRIVVRIFCRTG